MGTMKKLKDINKRAICLLKPKMMIEEEKLLYVKIEKLKCNKILLYCYKTVRTAYGQEVMQQHVVIYVPDLLTSIPVEFRAPTLFFASQW